MNIFDVLKADKELKILKQQYFELTGKYPAFNYDEFESIEQFKDSIKKEIFTLKERLKPS